MLSGWMDAINSQRGQLGANLQRLHAERENNEAKFSVQDFALSRIADVNIAEESTLFAANKVRAQASTAVLAQAQKLNIGVPDLLGSVTIGQK